VLSKSPRPVLKLHKRSQAGISRQFRKDDFHTTSSWTIAPVSRRLKLAICGNRHSHATSSRTARARISRRENSARCNRSASIIALGHDSRDQAVADIARCMPMTVASQRRSTAELVSPNLKSLEEARAAKRRSADRYGLAWTQSFLQQHSLAAAIVFFYSRNLLFATVRAFLVLVRRRDPRCLGHATEEQIVSPRFFQSNRE
jgi:hypothetical protein